MLISLGYLRISYAYHPSFQVLESHPEPMPMVIAMDLLTDPRQ